MRFKLLFIQEFLVCWFIFLAVVLYIQPSTIDKSMGTIGLIALIIYYIIFYIGLKSSKDKLAIQNENLLVYKPVSKSIIYLGALYYLFCVIYVIKFYTGMNMATVIQNLLTGNSNYAAYQLFFNESELVKFSFSKLLPISMLAYIKFFLLFSIYSLVLKRKFYSSFIKIIFGIIIFFYFIFSIARGTNFEIFEIFLAFLFFKFFLSNKVLPKKINFKTFVIPLIILALISTYFITSINVRVQGAELLCYTEEICYLPDSFFATNFSPLAFLSFALGGYFSFGLYYTGVLFSKFYFTSFENFLDFLIIGGNLRNYRNGEFVCSIVDCGVNWEPDISVFLNKFGLVVFLCLIFLMGRYFNYLFIKSKMHTDSFIYLVVLYYLTLELVSLPCGQFLFISSSNVIVFSSFVLVNLFKIINGKIRTNNRF